MTGAWGAFILLVFAGVMLAGCSPSRDTAEERQVHEEEDFPDTPVGRLMRDHVAAAVGTGRDAEAKYQASLTLLRRQSQSVTELIGQTYGKIEEDRYFRRWLLVETLRELHADHTLDTLKTIAESPIPDEKWSDEEAFSQDREISIRTTAVAGIADLASRENAEAERILTSFFKHENLAVRRTAIVGYANAGRDYEGRIRFLEQMLPADDHGFITLKATDIRTVAHPDIPDIQLEEPQAEGDVPRAHREVE
jgi:hypothetical protein